MFGTYQIHQLYLIKLESSYPKDDIYQQWSHVAQRFPTRICFKTCFKRNTDGHWTTGSLLLTWTFHSNDLKLNIIYNPTYSTNTFLSHYFTSKALCNVDVFFSCSSAKNLSYCSCRKFHKLTAIKRQHKDIT